MVIMIAIGVGIFVGFNMEWKSLEVDAFGFLKDTHYADYRLYAEGGFSEDDIKAIQNIDGVDAATRYFSVNVGIKDTKKTVTLNVSEDYTISTMMITDGAEYDESSDGIWLSDRFADENGIGLGDTLTLTYTGLEISGEVIGLVKSGENIICVRYIMELMNLMVAILIVAAIVLGIVVLYNLGVMSYVERHRELATLKVLGFRDKAIGKLLVSQNIWMTLLGILIGLPGGYGTGKRI